MVFASTYRHFPLVILVIACSFWQSQLHAATLMYVSDPTSSSAGRGYDIILERPENIEQLLPAVSNLGALGGRTVETSVCEDAGWFAAAYGDTGEYGGPESVGLFCGATTQHEAEYSAMRLCDERRSTSKIYCELEYVKYDPGNISFLRSYEISDPETGTFKTKGSGYAYGGEHGKYNGLNPTPPAEDVEEPAEISVSEATPVTSSSPSEPVSEKTEQAINSCKSSLEQVMAPGKTQCTITYQVMFDRAASRYSEPEDLAAKNAAEREAETKRDSCLDAWQTRLDQALQSCE